MRSVKRCIVASAIALLGSLAAPTAFGAVTIGPQLSALTTTAPSYNCSASKDCTVATTVLGTAPALPGGLRSPVNGAVVSMTVKTASTIASVTPRVLRPAGGTTYSGAGTASTELVFPAGSVTTLPLGSALVIRAGDIVGVQCCRNGGDSIFSTNLPGSGAVFSTWGVGPNPILLDGQTDSPDSIHTDSVLMMNATIEPANVVGVSPAEIKKRSKVNFRVSIPNDGLLGAGGCGASKCKKCKACYPTAARGQRVVAGQTIRFSLSITRAARSKAADKGKLKFRVPVTYTPDLGTAARVLTDRLVLTAPGKP